MTEQGFHSGDIVALFAMVTVGKVECDLPHTRQQVSAFLSCLLLYLGLRAGGISLSALAHLLFLFSSYLGGHVGEPLWA